jgi:hypothetical protein
MMSRLDPKVQEENRKAFADAKAEAEHKQKVKQWLRDNPEIGVLNGPKYYRFVNNVEIAVKELEN